MSFTMHKARLNDILGGAKSALEYVEMDPSERYGRFRDILGKGAIKTVYKAFDEVLGMEVAWNQIKLNNVFRSPEELQRLYSEVLLLKDLDHSSIMRFHASWIDTDRRTFNFITEMFTSGTLREYRQRYKTVNMRAIKNWVRQILEGLAYLHGHDPPVIHRDLKCDNIFVNGHLGQVKIGDLGLAAMLRGSHHAHSVIGTPEFMAPELYEEEYDELVDIYSFGMCVLEMLTSEYPYSECTNPAQIYKKVTSGKLPAAFYRIDDVEAQRFVGRCLEPASKRPSARELLMDPFLAADEEDESAKFPSQKLIPNGKLLEVEPCFVDQAKSPDMTITGTLNPEDDTIFLRVQISDKDGKARNIFFPFDITSDTALEVATEMVKELEITDWMPVDIAEMIDEEISALVPTWRSTQYQKQHSFNYIDDDDDDDDDNVEISTRHPSYSLSSQSSSQASLPELLEKINHDWLQVRTDDDTSSRSSMNSYDCSNLCWATESDADLSSKGTRESVLIQKTNKCTRCRSKNGCCVSNHQRPKMTRVRSLVNLRSQLLHRSLVEEINKRRLFKTVGAVENIGYHEPAEYSCKGNGSFQRFGW